MGNSGEGICQKWGPPPLQNEAVIGEDAKRGCGFFSIVGYIEWYAEGENSERDMFLEFLTFLCMHISIAVIFFRDSCMIMFEE